MSRSISQKNTSPEETMDKKTARTGYSNKKKMSGNRKGSNLTKKKISSDSEGAENTFCSHRTPRQLHASIYMDGSS